MFDLSEVTRSYYEFQPGDIIEKFSECSAQSYTLINKKRDSVSDNPAIWKTANIEAQVMSSDGIRFKPGTSNIVDQGLKQSEITFQLMATIINPSVNFIYTGNTFKVTITCVNSSPITITSVDQFTSSSLPSKIQTLELFTHYETDSGEKVIELLIIQPDA